MGQWTKFKRLALSFGAVCTVMTGLGGIAFAKIAERTVPAASSPAPSMVMTSLHLPVIHHPVRVRLPLVSPWNPALLGQRQELNYERLPGYTGTMYLFRPAETAFGSSLPVVVYIHGGALVKGSAIIRNNPLSPHEWVIAHVEANVIHQGFAFVSVNYRLAPKYKWPSQIDDVAAALRYIQTVAVQYHLDASRIAVMGDSAGGALSSLVGLSGERQGQVRETAFGALPPVAGVVDMFGPVDRRFLQETWTAKHGNLPNPVFGPLTPRVVRQASAVAYVHRSAPPFLILQGTRDTIVPPWLSQELYQRLCKVGDTARLVMIHHSEHEFLPQGGPISPSKSVIVDRITEFLFHVLRPSHDLMLNAHESVHTV